MAERNLICITLLIAVGVIVNANDQYGSDGPRGRFLFKPKPAPVIVHSFPTPIHPGYESSYNPSPFGIQNSRPIQHGYNNNPSYYDQRQLSDCGFWCKRHDGTFYCCEEIKPHGFKRGSCPVSREYCPHPRNVAPLFKKVGDARARQFLEDFSKVLRPKKCSVDYECERDDKCCYDVCLNDKICKTPLL